MKVVCKINNLNDFSNESVLRRLRKYIFLPDGEVDLEIGKEYTVYGVVFWDNSPWYYICVEDYDEYPTPFSAEFFEVSDDRLSSYWKLSSVVQGEAMSSLLFDEWAQNPSFYECLIEDDPEAVTLFRKYRILIEQE